MQKVWKVASGSKEPVGSVEQLCDVLCDIRGLNGESEDFFDLRYDNEIHDPELLFGMKKAVDRIFSAIEKEEKILIHGDYDADGITGTAIQMAVLQQLGAEVSPWLPHRVDHGYGLNQEVIESLSDSFDLLITVDCGVGNFDEVKWLADRGKDVIVVDHHSIGDKIPPALAVLHPRHPEGEYPFGFLSGAGVSWKLAMALLRDERSGFHEDSDLEKWLLDLACLGTVADMVELKGENRAIVKFGLQVLRRSQRPGVRALLDSVRYGDEIDEEVLGFQVIPMINAVGRIEHPQPALDLLLSSTQEVAEEVVRTLKQVNQRRRNLSKRMLDEAEGLISDRNAPVVFVVNQAWPSGVVGLVAGSLSRKYAKPAFVVGGAGDQLVGSARAPEGANLIEILSTGKDHLMKYGGHLGAAGFTVVDGEAELLQKALLGESKVAVQEEVSETVVDAILAEEILSWDMLDMVDKFAPFGEGNTKPLFAMKEIELVDWRPVGKKEDHAKLTFRVNDDVLDGIGFSLVEGMVDSGVDVGGVVDLLFQLEVNEFRGRRSLQLNVHDIALAGKVRFLSK